MEQSQVEKIIRCITPLFNGDKTGHDIFHTLRVYHLALKIAREEKANEKLVTLASLLHDVDDPKLFQTLDFANARAIMKACNIEKEIVTIVIGIIKEVSFKGKDSVIPATLEGKIVQDADRLDAIGAIGIARAFAYGGAKNRVMYDPNEKPLSEMDENAYRNHKGTTINHFYEKLLLLKDMLNTVEARKIAQNRHEFMKRFLDEFFLEWEEKD